jgi:hypothetical protein
MRKIEQQMIAAIKAKTERTLGNTSVWRSETLNCMDVYLHGNHIAAIQDDGQVRVTLAGWPTPTTRSRVNALLREFAPRNAHVYQAKGSQYYSQGGVAEEIGASEWVSV